MAGGTAGAPGRGGGTSVRAAMAASACAGPVDERYAGAECTPTAAKTSGYAAATVSAIAPPAESPAT